MLDKTTQKLFVFPTNRAIREYISSLENKNIFLPKVISIGDFFQKVIFLSEKRMISPQLKIIYLQQVIQDIDVKKLGINSSFSSFLKQSEYIIRFFNELAVEFKTIQDLNDADTYAHYQDHLDILQAIQTKYHEILLKNNYIDQSLLPAYYKINEDYIKQFKEMQIVHEGVFSSFELKIIDEISSLVSVDVQYKKNNSINSDIIHIVPIKQRILQIGFIKQKIYEMITVQKIDPSSIVIVLPDESFHEMLALFDEENYFNFAMGNNIKQSKIYQTVETINKLLINYEPKDENKKEFFGIDNQLFQSTKNNWNSIVNEEMFLTIFDQLIMHESNTQIVEKLNELKTSLTILFFTHELNLKLKHIFRIIQNKISEITLDDTSGGKITVLGILETRGVAYDGVIVIDFNDDKIPKRSVKDKFLSTKVKEFAKLPTSFHREELQKYYYTNLFSRAKKVAISYVNDEISIKSRFINSILSDVKEDYNIYDFEKILYKSRKINIFKQEIIKNIDLSKRTWSATSLKTYLQCKRKYYFHYIKRLKEHSISLKPQGYEVGNIIHKVLEQLVINDSLTISNINTQLSIYQNNNPYLTMDLEVWKKKLVNFVYMEKARKEDGSSVYAVEKSFNFVHNGIALKGTIDRMDRLSDGTYCILDYKTSNNLKVDTPKTYEKSYDFQLEFYFLSQEKKIISSVGYYDLFNTTIKNEIMLENKIKKLNTHLKALKTKQVNFDLCEDKTICLYCNYKLLCNRD
ncbi:FIG00388203: hypothetical protein [hydrothermal vent metagenome]|uniref:PD-(D/E)XK endonuclease-like domain-containing protein n=1 Tax=hydrothermal vent metagenome TaxID=652676 RepID=A0A3B1E236_9ZZZZ